MAIKVYSALMSHSGGTKFYEVITLIDELSNQSVVVRRWGKMTAINGGGETKIESYRNPREATVMANTTLSQKKKRGYSQVGSTFGLHGAERLNEKFLHDRLKAHYCGNSGWPNDIMSALGVDMTNPAATQLSTQPGSERVEPDRSHMTDWGSW